MHMKYYPIILGLFLLSCETKNESSLEAKYLNFSSFNEKKENFNDSVCRLATDSAIKRFERNNFELFVFTSPDSSETPIHILQDKFGLKVIGFFGDNMVFRFCYNECMISEFERKYKFNPIDSAKVIYDSLNKIGLTHIGHRFGTKSGDWERYIACNLEFPNGTALTSPYPLVKVAFQILPSGIIDSIQLIKSFSPEYDSAALKLIRQMPKWRPSRGEDGKYHTVYMDEFPIRFNPERKEKYCR
jgi:hypothetical protein